jgi:predicted rRNA methylase YqxC with S4 and FtsJ domains
VRRRVVQECVDFVTGEGLGRAAAVLGVCDSSIPGPAGNREYLVYIAAAGHPTVQEHTPDVRAQIDAAIAER